MVSSSRDRSHSQRRDSVVSTIARTPPPAFLFPIQRCQRPDRLSPTPLFSAGGRRRRLSSCRPFWCQSILSDFFAALQSLRRNQGSGRKSRCGAARGSPHKSVAIRLSCGKIVVSWRKASRLSRPVFRPETTPLPAGGGYLVGRPEPVNDPLQIRRNPLCAKAKLCPRPGRRRPALALPAPCP